MGDSRKGKKSKRKTPPASDTAEPTARTESARTARRQRAIEVHQSRRRERLLVGAVLLATFLAYTNAFSGEFVYDDRFQILKNPTIKSLSNIPRVFTQSVWQFMNQGSAGAVGPYYRPLFNVALIVNYQMFELSVFGWHLVSLLFHLAVTLLVYMLSRRFGLSMLGGLAAAAVFGLHPVHSESVAWISGIPDPMAGAFLLGSVLVYERYRESTLHRSAYLAGSICLAFLAMLCKETAIVLPVFLMFREALDRKEGESRSTTFLNGAKRAAPFFGSAAVYLLLRYAVLGFLSKPEPAAAATTAAQVALTIPSILISYVRMLIFPYPLAVVYDQTYIESAADPRLWMALIALALIGATAFLLSRKSVVARVALAFLVLFLIPVLNLKAFKPEESLLHDRYLYLPSIGFSIVVGLAFAWFAARSNQRVRLFATSVAVAVGIVFFGLTFNQNRAWQSDTAMAGHALALFPHWSFLHNYVGASYSQSNKWLDAEREYLEAIRYRPNYADALSNLGDAYREQGRLPEAEQTYLKAIDSGAPYADTRYNLAVTYTSMNRLADAERALLGALEIQPDHVKARYNLGWVYAQQSRDAEAEQAYIKTLEYDPTYPEPRINLAVILTKQRRFDEAIDHLLKAQRNAPDNPVMLYALGDAYRQAGRYSEALAAFGQLQARQPQHPLVYTSLGLCYEASGNKALAKTNYEKAIGIAPAEQWTNVAREHLAKL